MLLLLLHDDRAWAARPAAAADLIAVARMAEGSDHASEEVVLPHPSARHSHREAISSDLK